MAYWLFKTEPETFSWEMQKNKGAKARALERRVRNHTAKLNMMAMKEGRSGLLLSLRRGEKAVVGIVEVIGGHYPDFCPRRESVFSGLVDVKAAEDMPGPVTLADCKGNPKLAEMSLVKSFRLRIGAGGAEMRRSSARWRGL